jgi:hypothetical protein
VTAFFLPGAGDPATAEDAYRSMRQQLALSLGRVPSHRRIRELWTRRGSRDCITEVGTADPICGDTVEAIFDMGSHQPFVIWYQPRGMSGEEPSGNYEVVGCNAYSVVEFES